MQSYIPISMLFLFLLYHSMIWEQDEKVISRTQMPALHEHFFLCPDQPSASKGALLPRASSLKVVLELKLLIYESLVDLKYPV